MPDSDTDKLLTVLLMVVAAGLTVQSLAILVMAGAIRRIASKVDVLSEDVKKTMGVLSARADQVLAIAKGVGEGLRTVQENLTSTSAIVQRRAIELDAFLGEATDAARLQIARIQDVVDNASRSVEETFETLQRGIIAPISEINAVVTGIRVGLAVFRRRKVPATPSERDGEMFI